MVSHTEQAGVDKPAPIITDAHGLEAANVTIPTGQGNLPAYFARPQLGGTAPVVLVVQEIFGLNNHIKDVVRRLAKRGYLAVAPDLFFRHGDASKETDMTAIRKIVAATPDTEAMADFDAALSFAASRDGDVSRAAITGFCWGGRIAWLYAAHNPLLKACAPWYGKLDGDRTPTQPHWPLDIAEELKVPALGFYGGDDPSIPPEQVALMREKLGDRGEIIVYDGAPHAFFADYRESYREGPAKDAWEKMIAFFKAGGAA